MADHLPKDIRKIMDRLKKSSTEKERRLLDELDRSLAKMVPAESPDMMRVESIVSSKTRNPMIQMIWGHNKGQLSVIAARGYAFQILEACEAGTQDAALVSAVMSTGQTEEMAYGLLTMVREHRRKFEGGPEV